MFTGLVEDTGSIARIHRKSDRAELVIRPKSMPVGDLALGESVAVNGVCLTVTTTDSNTFSVLAGAETLRRTNLGELGHSSIVNLERAMKLSDRLGGHLVSGHVDAVGRINSRRDMGANLEFNISLSSEVRSYVVEKGSIAVDGISLTVNRVDDNSFSVALIPHTAHVTTLGQKAVGRTVNLEVDIIGKYVEKLLGGFRGQ